MSKPPRPDAEPQKLPFGPRSSNLTKPGISIQFNTPSSGKVVRGRILPCFDFEKNPEDPDFATSWIPYRDATQVRADEHAEWNQWFFPFEIYSYWGPNKRSFFSPKAKARLGVATTAAEALDPIGRMSYMVAKDEKWQHLQHLTASTFNAAPGTPPPALARSRTMALMNFFGSHGDKDPQNFVLMIPEGGMEFIKSQLNKFRKASSTSRDPKWPDYMFGDITDPQTGLLSWSTLKPIGGGKTANTITFSKLDDSAEGVQVMPVNNEILSKRINFFDIDNHLHIPTPQEVLNWVIEDGVVPLEFIKAACGSYLDVPDAPTRPRPQTPTPDSDASPFKEVVSRIEDDDDDIPFLDAKAPENKMPTSGALAPDVLSALTAKPKPEADNSMEDYKRILADLEATTKH